MIKYWISQILECYDTIYYSPNERQIYKAKIRKYKGNWTQFNIENDNFYNLGAGG